MRAFSYLIVIFATCKYLFSSGLVQEAPDGSVCFNNCNGHGDCIDYSCHCWAGYIGDDCGTTFADTSDIVPILTAGHFNITRKNFTQIISQHKLILVGFSSYNCHKCITIEPSYRNISEQLRELSIPFGRANADKMKSIAAEVGAIELPALVLFHKLRPILYKGSHSTDAVMNYIHKQLEPPAKLLKSINEVNLFLNQQSNSNYGISTSMTVGFFTEYEDIEEDDYNEYIEVAKELQLNEDTYFGYVINPTIIKYYKKNKIIDRTPSLLMIGDGNITNTINLDELYGENIGISSWILKNSIPLVGKMTNNNFLLYEKQGLPILMMFLNLTDELTSQQGIIGGKTNNIYNEILLDELRQVAKEYKNSILFVYLDGILHEDQMKSLGLYGGKERLPSIAFNTRDGKQITFPEELPINKDTLVQFCSEYLSGKLNNINDIQNMAKKALQSVVPINNKNKVIRKEIKQAPSIVQGISEQFGDGIKGDNAIITINLANFHDIILSDDNNKDIVLLLHSKNCEQCSYFNVYYKRMADRFKEMNIPSLLIAQMDVSIETPPKEMNLMVGTLPLLVMIPASDKNPPWNFYSGKVTSEYCIKPLFYCGFYIKLYIC